MVRRAPALENLRRHIITTGSTFLRNAQRSPGVTCTTCGGIPNPGFTDCYACGGRADSPGLADLLGFITYAWDGSQAGRMMYAYKANPPGETSRELVIYLLTYAVVAHWDCIARQEGSHPDGWAYVPSLSGRKGAHPVTEIASRFMGNVPNVPVSPSVITGSARSFDPAHFSVPPTTARHVLLLDDTWTTGGHLQSVSAALKVAGVEQVTGLAVARWLDPRWGSTREFIDGLPPTFDPAICPFTGLPC